MTRQRSTTPEPLSAVLRRLAERMRLEAEVLDAQAAEAESREQAPPEDDPLLDVPAIAAELGLAISSARDKCKRGEIKAMKDGAGWRARRSAVRAYERRRTQ